MASEKTLAKEGAREGATSRGLQWLAMALDTFHDAKLSRGGLPVPAGPSSLVTVSKRTLTIGAPPTGLLPDGSFDVHVAMLPLLESGPVSASKILASAFPPYVVIDSLNGTTSTPPTTWGLVTAVSVPRGNATFPTPDNPIAPPGSGLNPNGRTQGLGVSDITASFGPVTKDETDGTVRLIAFAVEVALSGARVGRGGTLVTYGQSSSRSTFQVCSGTAINGYGVGCQTFHGPPGSLQDALDMPDAQQWSADEGALMQGRFTDLTTPPSPPKPTALLMLSNDFVPGLFAPDTPLASTWFYTRVRSGTDVGCLLTHPLTSTETTGAYFSGLQGPTATNPYGDQVTVTMTAILEKFPTTSEPEALKSAMICPTYDPVAIQMYFDAMQVLPYAVPLSMNPLGEWAQMAYNAAKQHAPMVSGLLGMIPHPVAKAASAAIGFAGKVAGAKHEGKTKKGGKSKLKKKK